jgi:hypothetical protein
MSINTGGTPTLATLNSRTAPGEKDRIAAAHSL